MNSGTSLPPVQQRSAHVRTRTRSTASSVGADYNIEYGLRNEAGEQQIEEEIAEIKRYEDFTTIDWVQDAVREHARRQLRKQQLSGWRNNNGKVGWKYRLYESYEAGQAWMVVTLIGMAIGMIAAIINIVSEWLSDIKIGHCKTAFYLNEEFCCWGEDNGCDAWENWSGFALINYLIYTFMAVSFALASASLVQAYAPYAAGSGISEIKCIIAGFVMKGFLGFWTLFIKSVALPITIASVIMFELTGAVDYILPTMIVVGMSKLVTTLLGGKGGIADRVIPFSGFPFLDSKEEHNFGVPVSRVMRTAVVTIPMTGLELKDVEKLLSSDKYQGFPVVESEKNRILYGYIGHTELRYAVDRIRRNRPVAPSTPCNFIPPHAAAQFLREDNPDASPADALIDFGRYVDSAPITANPNLPLETVIDLFCKIGPRVILVEFQGKLVGLVTVKDCLKFQHKVEGTEIGVRDAFEDAQEKLWLLIQRVSGWVADRVFSVSGGRIHLRAMNDHMAFSQRDSMMPSTLQEEAMRGNRRAELGNVFIIVIPLSIDLPIPQRL
ncbi:H(+)/Cl(-) exchange transporter 3 [Ceratocystis platani]|uniref:H(+)/Cl(-) exchange transporter 3 n=1 Tax=Ceratocystis fimbriata f. sp. platani TaxID=88771 RepID=A0A0F8D4M8_CERFI|nr:H(+)/Cl(-) exchange transporter 3 [Ceratocystis platani]